MVLEAPQTCIRLHSHPGNGSGGNLGGLKEEDLLHSLWGGQAASVWKTLVWAQTRPDQDQEEMCPASPPQCLVLFKWLEKLKTGGEWVPWGLLSRSEHLHEPVGKPGLGTDPESCSPQHSGEQGRRISIHLPSLL